MLHYFNAFGKDNVALDFADDGGFAVGVRRP
jgi:hypothetical protein